MLGYSRSSRTVESLEIPLYSIDSENDKTDRPNCLKAECLVIGYFRLVSNIALPILLIIDLNILCQAYGINIKLDERTRIYILIIVTAIFSVHLSFNIIFLVGLHKEKRGYVRAYLLFSVVDIVLVGFILLLGMVIERSYDMVFVKSGIHILLRVYFLLVIKNYYCKMEDPRNPVPINA